MVSRIDISSSASTLASGCLPVEGISTPASPHTRIAIRNSSRCFIGSPAPFPEFSPARYPCRYRARRPAPLPPSRCWTAAPPRKNSNAPCQYCTPPAPGQASPRYTPAAVAVIALALMSISPRRSSNVSHRPTASVRQNARAIRPHEPIIAHPRNRRNPVVLQRRIGRSKAGLHRGAIQNRQPSQRPGQRPRAIRRQRVNVIIHQSLKRVDAAEMPAGVDKTNPRRTSPRPRNPSSRRTTSVIWFAISPSSFVITRRPSARRVEHHQPVGGRHRGSRAPIMRDPVHAEQMIVFKMFPAPAARIQNLQSAIEISNPQPPARIHFQRRDIPVVKQRIFTPDNLLAPMPQRIRGQRIGLPVDCKIR